MVVDLKPLQNLNICNYFINILVRLGTVQLTEIHSPKEILLYEDVGPLQTVQIKSRREFNLQTTRGSKFSPTQAVKILKEFDCSHLPLL